MSKATKIWLIVAAVLVLVGIMVAGGAMMALEWNFSQLSTVRYETVTHNIDEDFSDISIMTDTNDVTIRPSEDSRVRVVCTEQKNLKHSVSVKDGVLYVKLEDTRKWYEHIHFGFNFNTAQITVYLPVGEYGALSVVTDTGYVEIAKDFTFSDISVSADTGDIKCFADAQNAIKIKTSTGAISVQGVEAKSLDLHVSTGNVNASGIAVTDSLTLRVTTGRATLTDATCHSFTSHGDTGDISLKNVIVTDKMHIERDTGDVNFDACDAGEMFIKTDTGDVTGTLLSEKIFIPNSDTGDVSVPKTLTGGRCEIITDTGDIRIKLK
jgi:DUF4097 and DUF4098 domain-containing protein YvlB